MEKYRVGDRVWYHCKNCCRAVPGKIIKINKLLDFSYAIRCENYGCWKLDWCTKMDIYGKVESSTGIAGRSIDQKTLECFSRPPKLMKPRLDALPDDCVSYCENDVEVLQEMYSKILYGSAYLPKIKKIIFNNPATIVFWEDGTKTVVKCDEPCITCQAPDDKRNTRFDPEKGLAMAIAKKALGNQGNYYNEFKKWLPKEEKNETRNDFR